MAEGTTENDGSTKQDLRGVRYGNKHEKGKNYNRGKNGMEEDRRKTENDVIGPDYKRGLK